MSRVFGFFQFLLILFAALPLAIIPYRSSLKIGEGLGSLLYHVWKSRREIAIRNLKAAAERGAIHLDSSPEAIIRRNFRNLGKSFIEVVKIYYGFGDRIMRGISINGAEHFEKAHSKGRGVLFITGHCGNWELNALTLSVKLTSMNAVARPIDNPYLNRLVEKTRQKYGNNVIYKRGALKKILVALKKNEAVGILMDQSVISSEGVAADFLGKKDYTMKTPAIIARKTGAAVLPLFIRRTEEGHVIEIGEEVELDGSADAEEAVFRDTVKFNSYIESYIRENPAEWLWIHRRWKRSDEAGRDVPPKKN